MEEKNINNQDNSSGKPLTILDIILIFLKYKKKILISTLTICIISIVLYFFVFDLIYFSTATIKSTGKGPSLLMGVEGLSDIGGIGDIVGGSSSSKELALYEAILMSRRCLEPLIIKFGLQERDEYKYMEDAIKDFQKSRMELDIDKISGVLNVGIYDKDRQLAKEMVEFLLEELNKINIELSVTNAKNNREFIEKRYFQAKEDLTRSEDSLKSFQLIYGIAPDLQIKASAQSVFTLEAELKAEEVKLDVLKQILSADQPEVKTQEAKVNSLRDKISGIQTSTDLTDFLRLGNSPQIAMSFLRLQRDVEIQTKILTFLLPVYEQAKIEEKKETPTILLLEKPYIAERKVKPKRLTMVVLSTFLSFFIFLMYVIIYEVYIKKLIFNIKTHR